MSGPRIVGLCEGYGGLTDAARRVFGGELVAYAEVKPAACALLEGRHVGVPNLGDLTAVDWTALARELEVDVVTAGWPCQPFAMGGRRLADLDPRAISPRMIDAIAALRPRVFVGENVAHTIRTGELARVVEALEAIGYRAAWTKLEACRVGAPHRRARVFVVAVDPDQGAPAVLPRWVSRFEDALPLLPTPEEKLARSGVDWQRVRRPASGGDDLTTVIARVAQRQTGSARWEWDELERVLERWAQVVGRPAPASLKPGTRKPHALALSAAFVEWLMGLETGHVTAGPLGVGRHSERAAALSLLGDGVVPRQAEAGVRDALASLVSAGRGVAA